ncbi:MAG: ABC transporter ATP-binding protein [Candidatus Aenigmarchaeota archaeon]|nr:ABC transporter ATP-binding protein [Candidatus Aenigmarchaeota archaeon]
MEIKTESLGFSYPGRSVLKDISIKIKSGDFVGITGSTGSGKTTLAYCLNGLIPHAIKGHMTGSVLVDGKDTRKKSMSELASRAGFVFQDPDWQIFSLSVHDEVAFGLRNLKMKNAEKRIKNALSMVGLDGYADEVPYNLSHGQKQKLCIASVLAMEPDAIILDEPTSQLDYRSMMNIYSILRNLNRAGKTVVVIEHDTDLIAEYAGSVIVIDKGTVVKHGKPSEVLSDKKLLGKLGIKVPEAYR